MGPGAAVLLLALAAGFIYVTGRRVVPLGANGYDNPTAPGGFTQAQIDYYLGGFTGHLSAAQGAQLGASAAAPLAAIPIYGWIAVGVSAAAGYFFGRQRNDTKIDRNIFASRLGFVGNNPVGVHTDVTTDISDKSKGLFSYLIFIGRADLTDYALHVIGRKDYDRDTQWMVDTMAALWSAGFAFPQ